MAKKNIIKTDKKVNFLEWYDEVIKVSEIAFHGTIKGTLFLSPLATKLWEQVQIILNDNFKNLEIENVLFPAIFPKSLLLKEKNHFKGFNPEVYNVLKSNFNFKKLDNSDNWSDEISILRPTSEILFSIYFKKVLINYSQLPLKLNQWANVYRYEKNPKPFLRNNEFYWQEGHALYRDEETGKDFCFKITDIYKNFFQNILAIYPFAGYKSNLEKFSGAKETYGFEIILEDGQFLQVATVHNLDKNFSVAFNIRAQDKDNKYFHPYNFSWGLSTRVIGAIIAVHGDDNGLVLPPFIAPFQIAIVGYDDKNKEILDYITKILNILKINNYRVIYKPNLNNSPSRTKINYIIKGVPVILEIGKNEVINNNITLLIRHNLAKISIDLGSFTNTYILNLLLDIHQKMLAKSKYFATMNVKTITNVDEMLASFKNKNGCKAYFDLNDINETLLKNKYKITVRVLLEKDTFLNKTCFLTNKPANSFVILGRAY
ncbi:aminoacyl--tRNA ligase-related protein [Mycoplasma sp. SG1]|uniref:aminoacyl--tRNA ligase-related protein n=1 Tax=Mycoplasma sp. SG1 TaxID=2810348 RepID=UPI002023D515|nr:aminoacyl--tRNA ligase-related protein [Mycoplasma sp. SG1]URM53104.1 hypothetical protein JRW51_02020 [Mycoplasma sp. SG1]